MIARHPGDPRAPRPWFPARRIGLGWGPPTCWQGWAVLAAYLLCILLVSSISDLHPLVAGFAGFAATFTFLAVCRATREPPSRAD